MATSYQLPDLLAMGRAFELRTNPHCSRVSLASEAWVRSLGVLSSLEEKQAAQTKAGLLTSLCFPTCDVPQLRLMMDFSTLMMLAEARGRAGSSPWDASSDAGSLRGGGDWAEVMRANVLLRHMLPSLQRLLSKARPAWRSRYSEYFRQFRDAQLLLAQSTGDSNTPHPDVETFIELKRSASGIELIFEMIEPLHDISYPEMNGASSRVREEGASLLKKLRQCAGDIVAWSGDIAAHNHNQSLAHSPPTLVSLLMSNRNIPLQAAIDHAASLTRQSLDVFIDTERLVKAGPVPALPALQPARKPRPKSHIARVSGTWNWLFSGGDSSSNGSAVPSFAYIDVEEPRRRSLMLERPSHEHDSWWSSVEEEEDVRIYVEALKDCIVGTLNWLYENEVYFGDKADEVKQYGWVFLKPKERGAG